MVGAGRCSVYAQWGPTLPLRPAALCDSTPPSSRFDCSTQGSTILIDSVAIGPEELEDEDVVEYEGPDWMTMEHKVQESFYE